VNSTAFYRLAGGFFLHAKTLYFSCTVKTPFSQPLAPHFPT